MQKVILIALAIVFSVAGLAVADQKQDKEAILTEFSAFADKDPSILSQAVFSMADMYMRDNKLDSAIALYEKAVAVLPKNEDLLSRLGSLYNQKMDYDKVAEIYQKLTELRPDNTWYFQMLSSALNSAGKKDKAVEVWNNLIAKKPNDANILNQASNFFVGINDMDNAIPLAEKAVNADSANTGYMQNLAGLYARAEKFDKAEATYKKILETAKDQWMKDWANGELLNIYQKQNKLDDVMAKYEAELAKNPNDINQYKRLGEVYSRKGDNKKLIETFEKAAKIAPDDRNVKNRLVDLYEGNNQLAEAVTLLSDIIKSAPNETYLVERSANIYSRLDKKDEAKKAWESLIAKSPNDAGVYSRYAEALYGWKDLNGAIAQLKKAQSLEPNSLNYTLRSASMLQDSGKTEEAKVLLGKISVESKEEWIKNEAKRRLEDITRMAQQAQAQAQVQTQAPLKEEMTKEAPKPETVAPAAPAPAVKKEEPKPAPKKKGFLGR